MNIETISLQELLILGILAREYSFSTIQKEVKAELIRRGFKIP